MTDQAANYTAEDAPWQMAGERAVLYARVSGDDRGKEGRNLAGQIDMGREYSAERGYHVVAALAEDDRGASGAAFELPQLNRIREMAAAGEFDVLIVREIDRLSRNLAKQLIVEEELRRAGVRIEYCLAEYPDTAEGRLQKHIKATVAEYEREKITERNTRGRSLKVKSGSVMANGRVTYGYTVVERDGKWAYVIDEPKAAIVRMIFHWYAYGTDDGRPASLTWICRRLNAMGIPTPKDDRGTKATGWATTTVGYMLRNTAYAGRWQWHTQAGQCYTVAVPALVDEATFDLVGQRLAQNKAHLRQLGKHDYLLRGMLACGECGRLATGHFHDDKRGRGYVYRYYRCAVGANSDPSRRDCRQSASFPAELMEGFVWSWVKSFLQDPAQLAQGLSEYQAEHERELAPFHERLKIADDKLAEYRAQLGRLIDLYLSGEFSKEMLLDHKTRLEATIAGLERERDGLQAKLNAVALTEDQVQTVKDLADQLQEDLAVIDDDFQGRRKVLEALGVTGTLAVENGERVLYAHINLGADGQAVRAQLSDSTLSCSPIHGPDGQEARDRRGTGRSGVTTNAER